MICTINLFGEKMTLFGYTGQILKADVSTGATTRLPTMDYTDRFIGGRGLAAKLYWDMVPRSKNL